MKEPDWDKMLRESEEALVRAIEMNDESRRALNRTLRMCGEPTVPEPPNVPAEVRALGHIIEMERHRR